MQTADQSAVPQVTLGAYILFGEALARVKVRKIAFARRASRMNRIIKVPTREIHYAKVR